MLNLQYWNILHPISNFNFNFFNFFLHFNPKEYRSTGLLTEVCRQETTALEKSIQINVESSTFNKTERGKEEEKKEKKKKKTCKYGGSELLGCS